VNGFSVVYQQFYSYVRQWLIVKSDVTGPDSNLDFRSDRTPRHHATDKHDAPPSHFNLILGQPAMF